jgi:signal peptidase I
MAAKNKAAVEAAAEALDKRFENILPPQNPFRDWTETIVASIAVVVAFRAYFLQPFQIPTGSMQPSLNGLIVHRVTTDDAMPAGPQRWIEELLGRSYVNLVATRDDKIRGLQPIKYLGIFDATRIHWQSGRTDTVGIPVKQLQAYGDGFGLQPGNVYKQGDIVARGFVQKGDYVFVDKMTYHFRKPHRDDVFVFRTEGIPGIGEGQNEAGQPVKGDYYIKRLAGLPGDVLRIDAPKLFLNGTVATGNGFERVMRAVDGYNGYVNIRNASYLRKPGETFEVPPGNYFALGDNSRGSSDSRFWGTVPEDNVVGRGYFVYWPPLNGHLGWIR